MDIAALVISILAFIFSVIQFITNSSRVKNESTLNRFYELQESVFTELNILLPTLPKENSNSERIKIEQSDENWEKITEYLAKIEHFSVGINTRIYSLRILNRAGGSYFIRLHDILSLVIEEKRTINASKGSHYDEFDRTVHSLMKLRVRNTEIDKVLSVLKNADPWPFQEPNNMSCGKKKEE